jgi:2-iminobutanoate/2-iminopropanoate deaminase
MNRQCISTPDAPAAIGPYSHANKADNFVFCSGQLGLDPKTGILAEGIGAQAIQALRNLGSVLEASGCSYADVVKTTIFLKDIRDFSTVNGIYAEFFKRDFPARSVVQVAALPKDALVEIEAIAYREGTDNGL